MQKRQIKTRNNASGAWKQDSVRFRSEYIITSNLTTSENFGVIMKKMTSGEMSLTNLKIDGDLTQLFPRLLSHVINFATTYDLVAELRREFPSQAIPGHVKTDLTAGHK